MCTIHMQNAIQQQSRVHRRLKNASSRKQNSKNVHAKITDNCFEAISPLMLVISTIGFVSMNRFHQCLKCMFLQWYSKVLAQKMHDMFHLKNIIYVYIGKDEQGKHSNYRAMWWHLKILHSVIILGYMHTHLCLHERINPRAKQDFIYCVYAN